MTDVEPAVLVSDVGLKVGENVGNLLASVLEEGILLVPASVATGLEVLPASVATGLEVLPPPASIVTGLVLLPLVDGEGA